jgi:predicted RNA binding protein YcfA (HicA-like mRNA interferase family)
VARLRPRRRLAREPAVKPVSGKQMGKVLEKRGWQLDRISGSHHIYTHPDGGRVTVPVHGNRDLKPGTQRSIMRDANITDDDL